MEKIIIKQREILGFRGLMVLESLIMFGLSGFTGWMIYLNFPDWIANDLLMPTKASVISILCLGFLWFPCLLSHLNRPWMPLLISVLGGVYLSLPMIVWQEKFWIPAVIGLGLFLFSGIIGTVFSRQVKKLGIKKLLPYCLYLSILAIGISLGLMIKENYQLSMIPLYGSFSISAAFINMLNFAEADIFRSRSTEKQFGRHAEYKFSVLFYLNILNCLFNIDCGRILLVTYYQINLRHYMKWGR